MIIRYDGYCQLCSRSVQWIIRNDRKARFTYMPLQDAAPPGILEQSGDTVQLFVGGKRYERSTAILMIAVRLRFPFPLLAILFLVPSFIRDALYKVVAGKRKVFGSRSTCYMP